MLIHFLHFDIIKTNKRLIWSIHGEQHDSNTSLLSYSEQAVLLNTGLSFCTAKYKYFASYSAEIIQQKENKGVYSIPHLCWLLME
jgi:hypothetical protein